MRVDIIGAGVSGLACATELKARGATVRVFEQGAELGAQACSWFAGGMLAPWCESETAEEPVGRFGAESIEWWSRHVDGVEKMGTLVVANARDAGELKRFSRRTGHHRWLDADGIAQLEPDLAGRFRQALFFEQEAHLDPRKANRALVEKLRSCGTTFCFNETASPADLTADCVIDCRGLKAADELKDLRGVHGEMLLIRSREVRFNRPLRLLHPRHPIYLVPRGDGIYMLGATVLESAGTRNMTVRAALELLGAVYALHPALGEAEIIETGADARPAFPDNLPRLRRRGRTLYANGLYRHGYLLAPALARMAADAVYDSTLTPEFMDENSPQR